MGWKHRAGQREASERSRRRGGKTWRVMLAAAAHDPSPESPFCLHPHPDPNPPSQYPQTLSNSSAGPPLQAETTDAMARLPFLAKHEHPHLVHSLRNPRVVKASWAACAAAWGGAGLERAEEGRGKGRRLPRQQGSPCRACALHSSAGDACRAEESFALTLMLLLCCMFSRGRQLVPLGGLRPGLSPSRARAAAQPGRHRRLLLHCPPCCDRSCVLPSSILPSLPSPLALPLAPCHPCPHSTGPGG